MAEQVKPPRAPSLEPISPKPLGPGDQKLLENLERWANSRGLQPPELPDQKAN
jgi:hypothetical protein